MIWFNRVLLLRCVFMLPHFPSSFLRHVTARLDADATNGLHKPANADATPDGPDAADASDAADAAANASRHVGVADADGPCGEALLLQPGHRAEHVLLVVPTRAALSVRLLASWSGYWGVTAWSEPTAAAAATAATC